MFDCWYTKEATIQTIQILNRENWRLTNGGHYPTSVHPLNLRKEKCKA